MTENYLNEFERWVAGPTARKQQLRAELEEHLRSAESAGDVGTLSRLGTPREAAEAFSQGYELTPASLRRRIGAAVVDLGIFMGLIVGASGLGAWDAEVGPGLRVDGNNADFWSMGVMPVAMILAAGLWWLVALPLLEWRTGRTAGKALFGLRTISESGVAPTFGQVVLRRLTLIFSGPLQLIDWGFVFFNPKHQRGLDVLAKTLVVSDPAEDKVPMGETVKVHS